MAAVIIGVAALAACGAPAGAAASPDVSVAAPPPDIARLVDIGGGRSMFLECRGTGSPTVVLVSGTGGAADEWAVAIDAADTAVTEPRPSGSAVLPTVAEFTRVCAYDRPGTTRSDGQMSPSTLVFQPTSAHDGVRDLQAVLTAAGERPPYVLVGASWGAMITDLFARTNTTEDAGLVTVDGASPFLEETLTPAQWSDWMRKIAAMDSASGLETPDYPGSVQQIRAAPSLPQPRPAAVLTSDEPWDLQVGDTGSTWPAWLAAQHRLAEELHAEHITDTHSGHAIAVEQPARVSAAIRQVVDQARR